MKEKFKKITNDMIDEIAMKSEFSTNSLSLNIQVAYAVNLIDLNWHDILFGIENGYFDYNSAIEYATILASNDNNCDSKIFDLASIFKSEIIQENVRIQEIITELANLVQEKEKAETKDKIMYVLLYWLYDNKDNFADPLQVVEFIYDDFGFPKSISKFVRYMPSKLKGSETQIYKNWVEYLSSQKNRFGAGRD